MTLHDTTKLYDYHFLLLVFFMLLIYTTCHANSGINKGMEVQCMDKDALLQFKQGIVVDRCGLLDSWGRGLDCCQWRGIRCNNYTGRFISLHLRGYLFEEYSNKRCLEGKISDSLAELKHIKYLDLSLNNFKMQTIPIFVSSLLNLEHLNLSNAFFHGVIPNEIGNLSRLSSLDLSCLHDDSCFMRVETLSWLSNLRLLRAVNLGGIDLRLASNWVSIINGLPFLEVVSMDHCSLSVQLPSSISYHNSSNILQVISLSANLFSGPSIFHLLYNLSRIEASLEYLDLSYNLFTQGIPSFFWKMNSLSHLDLSYCDLTGDIPSELGYMKNLSFLDLTFNDLSGPIPSKIWVIHNLSYLYLAWNRLEGPITNTISNLKHLVGLDLSVNNIQIKIEDLKSLGKLCRLQTLSLDGNNIAFEFSQVIRSLSSCAHKSLVSLTLSNTQVWGSVPKSINNFSSLEILNVDDNQLNGTVGEWIGQLSRLEQLSLSKNRLNGVLTNNHFSNLSNLKVLDLSYNQALVLNLSVNWTPPFQLDTLALGSCKIGPSFPKWLLTQHKITSLDISDAQICDVVPKSFWSSMSYALLYLNMSNNMIHGVLPDLFFTSQRLRLIDMSSNSLSGALPSCLGNNVEVLKLNNNKLSQGLFHMLCPKFEMGLNYLDLSNNLFSEMLPDCWRYFPNLSVMKLQNNNISGNLPSSIAAIHNLETLHLRNNSLSGELPTSWVNSSSLAILDLSHNSLCGIIPPSFGNDLKYLVILSLRNNHFSMGIHSNLCKLAHLQILDLSGNHISGCLPECLYNLDAMVSTSASSQYLQCDDYALFMWKRKEYSFDDTMGLLKGIDISNNNLQGQIPDEISSLVGLVFLNLSHNNLIGPIPSRIGQLSSLEFLDLSDNQLSGKIPTSLSSINYLEILDLSKNNLIGKIPPGTQLQGFDASAYKGNPGLCGAPLPKCPSDQVTPALQNNGDNIAQLEEHESDDILPGLGISVVLGVITGFWGVCGTLVLKRSWRIAFLRFYEATRDRVYVMLAVTIGRA